MDRVVRQGAKVAKNASNKRKWEGDHGRSSSQQPNKRHKVIRAHAVGPSNKKEYVGTLPLCNKCKFHHTSPCTGKCRNYKRVGHRTRDCRTLVPITTQRPSVANQKPKVICYDCGKPGHYKSDCPKWKNQNHVNQYWKEKARGDPNVAIDNVHA
ncbi:reverse transcriptase domain-containing protein [Tanacetum coccineum]